MTCFYHHGVSHSTDSCVYAVQKNAMTLLATVAEVGKKWSRGCEVHRTGTEVLHVGLRRPDVDIHRPKLRFLSVFGVSKWTSSPRQQSVPFLSLDDHARSLCNLDVVKWCWGFAVVCVPVWLCFWTVNLVSNCRISVADFCWCCEYTVIRAVKLMWWCLLCLCPHRA